MTFARCASTVLTLIPSSLAIFLLEYACQTKDTISRSRRLNGLLGARRFVCVALSRRFVPGLTGRAVRRFGLVAVIAAAPAVRPILDRVPEGGQVGCGFARYTGRDVPGP